MSVVASTPISRATSASVSPRVAARARSSAMRCGGRCTFGWMGGHGHSHPCVRCGRRCDARTGTLPVRHRSRMRSDGCLARARRQRRRWWRGDRRRSGCVWVLRTRYRSSQTPVMSTSTARVPRVQGKLSWMRFTYRRILSSRSTTSLGAVGRAGARPDGYRVFCASEDHRALAGCHAGARGDSQTRSAHLACGTRPHDPVHPFPSTYAPAAHHPSIRRHCGGQGRE